MWSGLVVAVWRRKAFRSAAKAALVSGLAWRSCLRRAAAEAVLGACVVRRDRRTELVLWAIASHGMYES